MDLRRSIRRNITHGGDPVTLAFKGRKRQKKRLVIFLDISGSMNLYSLFLVRFAYALQKHFKRVDTFLFSTSVVEVSDLLRARKLSDALNGLSQSAPEWSGGTRIGGSLREFNRQRGQKSSFAQYCLYYPERRLGHRRAGSSGKGAAHHSQPRAKAVVAESIAGTKGLSTHHAWHERRASLC